MIDFQKKFPLSQYSYSPIQRGSEQSLAAYGPSWKQATAAQREMRKAYMMTGRGNFFLDKLKEWDNSIKEQYEQAVPNKLARYVLDKIGGKAVDWTLHKLLGKGLYRGRGGFFGGLLGSLIPGVGYDQGSKWGDVAYNAIGKVGDALNPIGKQMYGGGLYRGRGAYATNNLVTDGGATASNVVPQFNPSDMHEITYSNREFVRDIYAPASGTVFSLESWSLNPGLVQAFPWLSQLALNFEEYEFIQLAFTYKSTVADFASASGQVGQIAMATQYNPNSDAFADKEEMMLYEGGMSCKTTESLIHGIECDPQKLAGAAQKYVRQGQLPASEDLKNYDLGKTSIAVLNVPSTYAGQQIGELWVSYTIRLRKPKLVSANAYNVRIDNFAHYNTSAVTSSQSALNFGTLLIGSRNSLGCTITAIANGVNQATTTATWDNLTAALTTPPAAITGTQQQFKITFPNDYSGIISVRLQICDTTALNWGLQVCTERTSTIKRFRDIPQLNPQSSSTAIWTHFRSTIDNSDGGLFSAECELHLRILPATGGYANELYVSTTGPTSGVMTFPRIQITQINSFCSVADNGSNDRLDLVSASGQSAFWANL